MLIAHDYRDLHQLIDRLEPEQADELREHALRLLTAAGGRFRVLQSFGGPGTDMGARAREIFRAEAGPMLITDTAQLVAS